MTRERANDEGERMAGSGWTPGVYTVCERDEIKKREDEGERGWGI